MVFLERGSGLKSNEQALAEFYVGSASFADGLEKRRRSTHSRDRFPRCAI